MRFFISNLVLPRLLQTKQLMVLFKPQSTSTKSRKANNMVPVLKGALETQGGLVAPKQTLGKAWGSSLKAVRQERIFLLWEQTSSGFFFSGCQLIEWSPPRWGGLSAELSLWIKMLVSSKGTLTSTHNHVWTSVQESHSPANLGHKINPQPCTWRQKTGRREPPIPRSGFWRNTQLL